MAESSPRQRLLTFLLLPAFVIAVLVLDGITFRNSFQLEKLREQSVLEATFLLANEKADRLEKRIIDQDNVVASTIVLDDVSRFAADWLSVARVQTPTIRAAFLIALDSADREIVGFASRFPGLEDERFRRLLIFALLPEMKLDAQPQGELRHLHRILDGDTYLVSYWRRQSKGQSYLVVAWHDVAAIIEHVFPELYPESDQTSRINVVDVDGHIVYGKPLGREGLTLGRQFETTLYKWRLNVMMTSAQDLAAAVARRHVLEMVLVGLSGLVVIAGSIVILVAGARERKLANLKSDFVANVSHELKTPLSLVRMFSELLQSGRVENSAKRDEYLRIIVSESERLAALIENVLDFAKVERGKAAYQFSSANVNEVVARAVEACRVRAEREGVAVEQDLSATALVVSMDERAVEIAVINLVDNALKYAADGKVVRVQVRSEDAQVAIRVSDEGPGIADDEKRRVFERFVRGKNTRNQRIRGSGIGLALVKHIAESHGGSAWVEDRKGGGATFVITLSIRRPFFSSHDGLLLDQRAEEKWNG
ncbi:MAG TPA: HAMP domain-containing sensor histidine kinase [Polyangiaceae bacterium]|nr:HAMP domain-containing sensor histidine kinase [Polyangiaceae bacterium]